MSERVRIELVRDPSYEIAQDLIKNGGQCGSQEVLEAICSILGEVATDDEGPLFRRHEPAWTRPSDGERLPAYDKEFSYRAVRSAILQQMEIRPSRTP